LFSLVLASCIAGRRESPFPSFGWVVSTFGLGDNPLPPLVRGIEFSAVYEAEGCEQSGAIPAERSEHSGSIKY
jgi:hypothetical protein